MTTDLEPRLADLATAWDRAAAPVTFDEITGRVAAGTDAVTIELEHPTAPTRRRWALGVVGAAAAITSIVILANRHEPAGIDPVAPPTSEAVDASTVPATSATSVAPTEPPTTPVDTVPPTTVPAVMSDTDATAALAQLDAARTEALRGFTSIGFDVERTATYPDGRVYDDGGARPGGRMHVVLRNDGSAAVVSESFGTSYYDATAGTAQAMYTGADGQSAYQEIVGQADSSVALGVPTGLANGVITPIAQLSSGLVAITDDVLDGRPVWRVDQQFELVQGSTSPQQTWIDQATGITVQTHTSGMMAIDDTPLDEIITLTALEPGAPMPDGFPALFPPGAVVSTSGDPTAFGPIAIDQAAAEFDAPILVPTLAGDQVSVERMNFGTADGTATGAPVIAPVLHVRWFDGFVRTELRIDGYPSTMVWPDSCAGCTISLLEELRAAPISAEGVSVVRDNIGVTLTGDPDTIRAVIASLVEVTP